MLSSDTKKLSEFIKLNLNTSKNAGESPITALWFYLRSAGGNSVAFKVLCPANKPQMQRQQNQYPV